MVSLNVFANQNVRRLTVLPFTARRLSRCHLRCENPVSITPLFATHTSQDYSLHKRTAEVYMNLGPQEGSIPILELKSAAGAAGILFASH
jgi:hypothetical protein